jgi:hypothetical protein
MPTFLCLQRSLSSTTDASEAPSPAQLQEMYARFGAWQQTFADQLVDMGGKLGAGRLVHAQDAKDGPFTEVKELVGGYMIVQADDLEGAIAVASACPGLVRPGSGVEVVEIQKPG